MTFATNMSVFLFKLKLERFRVALGYLINWWWSTSQLQ